MNVYAARQVSLVLEEVSTSIFHALAEQTVSEAANRRDNALWRHVEDTHPVFRQSGGL